MRRLGGGGGREGRGYDISLGAEFDWQTGVQRGGGRGEGRGPSLTGSLLANCSAEWGYICIRGYKCTRPNGYICTDSSF